MLDLPVRKHKLRKRWKKRHRAQRKLRKSGKKRHRAQRKLRNLGNLRTILRNVHLWNLGGDASQWDTKSKDKKKVHFAIMLPRCYHFGVTPFYDTNWTKKENNTMFNIIRNVQHTETN